MRASLEVADIFRAAGPAYRMAHAGHLSLHQLKIMSAIEHCRTAAPGGHVRSEEHPSAPSSPTIRSSDHTKHHRLVQEGHNEDGWRGDQPARPARAGRAARRGV